MEKIILINHQLDYLVQAAPYFVKCFTEQSPAIVYQRFSNKKSLQPTFSGFEINGCLVVPDNQNYDGATKLC